MPFLIIYFYTCAKMSDIYVKNVHVSFIRCILYIERIANELFILRYTCVYFLKNETRHEPKILIQAFFTTKY